MSAIDQNSNGPRIDGTVAIITGGARGQGAATAKLFVESGATVYLTDVDDAEGEAAAQASGGTYLHHDVANPDDWTRVVARVVDDHGRVDALVNNAGIIEWQSMTQTSVETWQRVIAINQTGVFLGMNAVAPVMKQHGSGSIVNISSVGGMGGSGPCFAYGATKWAIRGMTRGAAQELGPFGIRVNAVLPGTIQSRMVENLDLDHMAKMAPLRRIAQPVDVARVTLWLTSDQAGYVTGADYLVDGGMRA